MITLPNPWRTRIAIQWPTSREALSDRMKRVLPSHGDGHRNVIELESFARAMGLDPDVLKQMRQQGPIDLSN